MKRLLFVMMVGLLIFAYGCGGGSDKAVMDDFADAFEAYVTDIEKAESADDVVKAVETFAGKMEDLKDGILKIKEKYPNLGKPGADLPEEFKEVQERLNKIFPKMMGLGAKLAQYASDPKVQEAQKKFMESMNVLQ